MLKCPLFAFFAFFAAIAFLPSPASWRFVLAHPSLRRCPPVLHPLLGRPAGGGLAEQPFDDVQGAVDARGHAGRRDDLAAVHEAPALLHLALWGGGLQSGDGP